MPTCLANGVSLYYEVSGDGSSVVFIHGHTLTAEMWDPQWQPVATRYRAIRYDLRGHGRSEAPAIGYTMALHAGDLITLLDHLHVAKATLVGLSMGGSIALEVALTYPQRVSGLVLLDSTLGGRPHVPEIRQLLHDVRAAVRREGVRAAMERLWLPGPMFAGVRRFPERFAAIRRMVEQYSGKDYLDDSPRPARAWQQVDRLNEIIVPTLVVVGESDVEDFQGISEALHAGIPGAKKAIIAGAGHIPNLEQPETFNQVLLDFLATALNVGSRDTFGGE